MKLAKVAAMTLMLGSLAACVPVKQDRAVENEAGDVAVENVVRVDSILLQLPTDQLQISLEKLAREAGLGLQYNAEVGFKSSQGTYSGSAVSIAKQLVKGLPLRVYRTEKDLVIDQVWQIVPGGTVKEQLMNSWDPKSRWSLVWETRSNQTVKAGAFFYGTFDTAVESLFQSLRATGSEIEPQFYPNYTVVVK